MSRDECIKILMIIDASYPNFNVRDEDVETTANSWFMFLKDYEYTTIETALKIYITTSGSAFAPSVSELIAAARKPMTLLEEDATSAWIKVRQAIKRGIYYAEEEFYSLPELAQKVVGYPEQLRSWAQMESKEIDTVVWSNFKKSYETIQKREKEIASMPVEIRKLIQNKIMIGEKNAE